jgi:RNA polymerase sigma-70 factor (ECF subfamily)
VLLEYYRSSSRETIVEDEEQIDIPDPSKDALSVVAHRQTEEKVRQVLDDLPERDRRLLKEVFLDERNKDEVCKDFGIDRDYLRVLLHRAKQSFKSLYLKSLTARSGMSSKL